MEGQPTNQSRNNTKHMWDKEEDKKLIECLLKLLESGNWRGDNSTFRSGFLQQLEKWMHEKIPNCQVRATPHISSRVKLWKKQYYALSEMLSASGFGWNDNEKSICCEKDVYDNWIKSHPSATGLRGKSFPYLEEWSVVFGRDHANRLGAESLVDAVEDIEREEATNEDGARNVVDMNDNLGDHRSWLIVLFMEAKQTFHQHRELTVAHPKKSRKRKMSSAEELNESIAQSICSMGSVFGTTSDNIAKLAGCFQFMEDDANKKDGVSKEIENKIQGLSLLDRIKAGAVISGDTNKTNYFFSLADDAKLEYVNWVLGGCKM